MYRIRWKIEEFHRELKQLTGLEACQCRKARIQRNHIACALLVWARLKAIAYQSCQTIYRRCATFSKRKLHPMLKLSKTKMWLKAKDGRNV